MSEGRGMLGDRSCKKCKTFNFTLQNMQSDVNYLQMIRDRLKQIELKISDLADYLQISRPTLYKYIESYDAKDFSSVNDKVVQLFNYIEKNPLAGKKTVVNFILTNLGTENEFGTPEANAVFSKIKKYLIENPDSTKTQFIKMFVQKSDFDEVAEYLLKIQPILRNRTPTQEEIELLKPYDEIRTIIENLQEEK